MHAVCIDPLEASHSCVKYFLSYETVTLQQSHYLIFTSINLKRLKYYHQSCTTRFRKGSQKQFIQHHDFYQLLKLKDQNSAHKRKSKKREIYMLTSMKRNFLAVINNLVPKSIFSIREDFKVLGTLIKMLRSLFRAYRRI